MGPEGNEAMLKISPSGIRGTVGGPLTTELALSFAQAFATYAGGGTILVGRDTRRSGEMYRSAVISGLLGAGARVVDLGVCPTPTLQLAVKKKRAKGGVAITAGHNQEDWNALKFIRPDGIYLDRKQGEELLEVFHQGNFRMAPWNRIRPVEKWDGAADLHRRILEEVFDIEAIRRRGFLVALDCGNGACSNFTPALLEEMGCEVVAFHTKETTPFPRDPHPHPASMSALAAICKALGADVGFAHDADGERLGIVDEKGEPLSEEMTLALAAEARLSRRPGILVTNVSTTRSLEEIARRHGSQVVRVPVGQAFASEAVVRMEAVLGGEGSGGVIVPEVLPSHDSAAAILLLLEFLALEGGSISELASRIPKRFMKKQSLPLPPRRIYSFLRALRRDLERERAGGAADFTDGVLLEERFGWIHFRASNTEPLLRVILEGRSERGLLRLERRAQKILREGGLVL